MNNKLSFFLLFLRVPLSRWTNINYTLTKMIVNMFLRKVDIIPLIHNGIGNERYLYIFIFSSSKRISIYFIFSDFQGNNLFLVNTVIFYLIICKLITPQIYVFKCKLFLIYMYLNAKIYIFNILSYINIFI